MQVENNRYNWLFHCFLYIIYLKVDLHFAGPTDKTTIPRSCPKDSRCYNPQRSRNKANRNAGKKTDSKERKKNAKTQDHTTQQAEYQNKQDDDTKAREEQPRNAYLMRGDQSSSSPHAIIRLPRQQYAKEEKSDNPRSELKAPQTDVVFAGKSILRGRQFVKQVVFVECWKGVRGRY